MRKKTVFLLLAVLFACIGVVAFIFEYQRPEISVVMSTYNRGDLKLSRAIDSVLNQTYRDFEFIIVDDGSSDNTADILKQYAERDSRIVILTNPQNRGLIYSLNRGLDAARGKYIARMDDDDISIPVRFEAQKKIMDAHPEITVTGTGNSVFIPSDNKLSKEVQYFSKIALLPYRIRPYDFSDAALTSYFNIPIFHPSAMIRRDFLERHKIRYRFDFPSAEDTPFWHEIIKKGGIILNFPGAFVLRGISDKKSGYRSEQIQSFNRFLNESLAEIMPERSFKGYVYQKQACQILEAMKHHIGKNRWFTIENIEHLEKINICSEKWRHFFE